MLTQYTFFGLTIFGFWLPLVFWLAVCVWLLASPHRRVELSPQAISILTVAGLLLSVVFAVPGGTGLKEIGTVTVVPLYFCLISRKASLWTVGFIAYLSTLLPDVLSAPFMRVGVSFAWVPWNILYNRPMFSHLFWVGGDGLKDWLLVGPLFAVALVAAGRAYLSQRDLQRNLSRQIHG